MTEDVWHILEVTPHSPADNAGLLPYGDYIVGTPEGNVHGEGGLGELVEDYLSRSLRLYVYNHEYGVTRLVNITPSRSWGGTGALGCVLGFGALHRLPAPLNEPPPDPGDTLFETARFSNEEGRPSSNLPRSHPSGSALYNSAISNPGAIGGNILSPPPSDGFLIPATTVTSHPGSAQSLGQGPPKAATKPGKKARKSVPGIGFDDVFREGEEKSREEDRPAGTKAPGAVPPPPTTTTAIKAAPQAAPADGKEQEQEQEPVAEEAG